MKKEGDFVSSCVKCGKYSHGNEYCYNCYQEELQQSIVKISKGPNTCIKCGKTINQLIYCEDCYRSNIALKIDDILLKYYNEYDQKNRTVEHQQISLQYTTKAARKCIHCDKNALLGSYLCEDHYHTFVKKQKNLYYENLIKIQKIFYSQQIEKKQITLCKICGKNSNNKPYCYNCYQKIKAGIIKTPQESYDNQKYDTNFQGNVYILTDTKTYSAAMDFAMLIQDNNLGKIIGEPSSNKPESYGDILNFQLPNSKLVISISYKKWCRIDQSKKDLLIEPDFPCDGKESISELYKIIKK